MTRCAVCNRPLRKPPLIWADVPVGPVCYRRRVPRVDLRPLVALAAEIDAVFDASGLGVLLDPVETPLRNRLRAMSKENSMPAGPTTEAGRAQHDLAWGDDKPEDGVGKELRFIGGHTWNREGCAACAAIAFIEEQAARSDEVSKCATEATEQI